MAYLLGVIKGALESDAGETSRAQAQAAVKRLLEVLQGRRGRNRNRSALASEEVTA